MLYRLCVLRELKKGPFLRLLVKSDSSFLLMSTFVVMLLVIIVCMLMTVVLHGLEVSA